MRRTILAALLVAGLAAATPAAASAAANAGTPNPSAGPTYTKTVLGNIQLGGDFIQGGDGEGQFNGAYSPPECWLQPWFYQPKSWQLGDPQPAASPQTAADADSFWWYVADQYPGLITAIAHMEGADASINGDFEMAQQGKNPAPGGPNPVTARWVWWGPNWLAGAAGWACAQGLIATADMNEGFLSLDPPAAPDTAPQEISSTDLATLARAALQLPAVSVQTSPSGATDRTSAYVNLPTNVTITYGSNPQPADTARVVFGGGVYLQARITTSRPVVTITANDPSAKITDNGVCSRAQACSVTFGTPTGTAPDVITATVTWTVRWTTSDGNAGVFTNPPSVVTATRAMIVREIQSVNG